MVWIVVLGGTGYAGSGIVAEGARRGHAVTAVSRTLPAARDRAVGVDYVNGNVTDPAFLAEVLSGTEVVVSSLSPRGELDGRIGDINQDVATLARRQGARLIVIGGFSSLRPAAGEPNAIDGGRVPDAYRSEAIQMNDVLRDLQGQPAGQDWLFVSPASQFGAHLPGESLGRYRIGGEVALFDEQGRSAISGPDFARAVLDEIDHPHRHHGHISVAY